jgi:hypothetical protein
LLVVPAVLVAEGLLALGLLVVRRVAVVLPIRVTQVVLLTAMVDRDVAPLVAVAVLLRLAV